MPNTDVLRGAKVGTLALDDFLEELNRRIAKTEDARSRSGTRSCLRETSR